MLNLYIKQFLDKPENQRFCGVIVDVNVTTQSGEVIDAIMASDITDISTWYENFKAERRAG